MGKIYLYPPPVPIRYRALSCTLVVQGLTPPIKGGDKEIVVAEQCRDRPAPIMAGLPQARFLNLSDTRKKP